MDTPITFWIGQQAHPLFTASFTIKGLLVFLLVAMLVGMISQIITKKQ